MDRDLGITFAGGGGRSFYQIGWMESWADQLLPRTAAIAACSAGAAMATMLLSGRIPETKVFFSEQRRDVHGTVNLRNLLEGKRPFPHDGIYRATLRFALEEGGLERIRAQPFPVRILCATLPRYVPTPVALLIGMGAYQLEKRLRPLMLHPTLPRRVGFRAHWWDARDCETPDQLVELVVSSSATPPFTKRGRYDQRTLIDGSMIDNAPAYLAEEGTNVRRNLVLLTRPYPDACMGVRGDRLYLGPDAPLPISRWDYTAKAPVEETLEVGRKDAQRHQSLVDAFLSN